MLETIGGGAVVLDYDGDGKMDLLLVDGDGLDERCELRHEPDARTRLWHNDGNLRFTDVTERAGIDVRGYGVGGAAADYDGDGRADFVVVGYGFTRLCRNRGDGTFEDVTRAAGLPVETRDTSTCAAWGDLDGDGLIDLVVTNYADQRTAAETTLRDELPPRHCPSHGRIVYCGPMGLPHGKNRVFFQRADHTFEDRTRTHLAGTDSYSFQAVAFDADGDGDLDVYVANDGEPNALYVNDGAGHLTDRAVEAGVAADTDFAAQASMGVDAADYDRDGRTDLFVTNFSESYNALYRNVTRRADAPCFQDVSLQTQISRPPQDRLGWGTKLVDFDGDGVLDAFVACSHVFPEAEEETHGAITNEQRPLLIRGLGAPDYRFADVTDRGGAALQVRKMWRGAAFADFDDDGDWDVLMTAMRDPPALLRNDGGERRAWVSLDLSGRPPLTSAAGARVVVELPDGTRIHDELHLGSSFGGSNDPRLLIGVGDAARLPRIEIRWPRGARTELRDVETRRRLVVEEPPR